MKKSRYSEEQIAFALRQAETGTSVAEVVRKMGVSEQTFYRWKKQYAGMGVGEIRRLKQLEEENRKLKQLVADLSLDKLMLPAAGTGGASGRHLRGERAPGLLRAPIPEVFAPLPVDRSGPGRSANAHQGNRGGAGALRLLPHLYLAPAGRVDREPQAGVPALSPGGPEHAGKTTAATCQRRVPGGSRATRVCE